MGHKKSGRRTIQPQSIVQVVAHSEQANATPDSSAINPGAENALLTGRINPLNVRKVRFQRAQPLISHRRNGRSR